MVASQAGPIIPQATLASIRKVVGAVAEGARVSQDIQKKVRYTARRTAYALSAAGLLRLLDQSGHSIKLTAQGRALSRTREGSEEEAQIFAANISASQLLCQLAPGLLGPHPPTAEQVANKIREAGGLSQNTALHRARMLLKWGSDLANRRMEIEGPRWRTQERTIMPVLEVRDFAQIKHAKIEFGDLTILVGPQGTGKSLVLQWFKAAIDIAEIYTALKDAGHDVKTRAALLDLIFGEGMSAAWGEHSSVLFDSRVVSPTSWTKGLKTTGRGRVFYIPAHRALLLAEGWPAPFIRLKADTPVVARLFSQNLYQRFSGREAAALFPVSRMLKEQYRLQIDQAVFHGGQVELEKDRLQYRLALKYADAKLPFMTWSAGQREFTPLLLGLYQLLPSRSSTKVQDVDWIVIEEPEMGLHPQAIAVFMLLVLDLLWRGYRVVISTHSPLILDVVWAIREISSRNHASSWRLLSQAWCVDDSRAVKEVMQHALTRDYRVFFLHYERDGVVVSRDISGLDPSSTDSAQADWGGLVSFSSRFGDAVRRAATQSVRGTGRG